MQNQRQNHNPLFRLHAYGQSIWLDSLSHRLLATGQLKRYIDEDSLTGVTANPSIFDKAISGSHDYDDAIRALSQQYSEAAKIYESLAIEDVQQAADLFRPVYDSTQGRDGFVSLEVSPLLANDTSGTIDEARRFWSMLNRPNVLIKVPGTVEGLPAIEQLTGEGMNINITLLFGLPRYREVAGAYVAGLDRLVRNGKPVNRVASVASFFLSRIDTMVDPMLEKIEKAGGEQGKIAAGLKGEVAIASAKVAYQIYQDVFTGARFRSLAEQGARPQRLLWASTSTKNPAYSDVKYVDTLIGKDTVNTMPEETLAAYRDHGKPAPRLEENVDHAHQVLADLERIGISIDRITEQLEIEGVQKFIASLDQLYHTINERRGSVVAQATSSSQAR